MNLAVTYEMDYYMFEQEITFILSRAETCKTETSESSRHSNQSGKRNLGHIMDPSKNVKLKHKAPVFYS